MAKCTFILPRRKLVHRMSYSDFRKSLYRHRRRPYRDYSYYSNWGNVLYNSQQSVVDQNIYNSGNMTNVYQTNNTYQSMQPHDWRRKK